MPNFFRALPRFLTVLSPCCLALGALAGANTVVPGQVLSAAPRFPIAASAVGSAIARLYARANAPGARYGVARYRLRIASTDERGAPITVAALIYLPLLHEGASAPVYVMGPGTTGLGSACAPTRENARLDNWGDYEAHMLSYAAQGYVGILPDWAGFDANRVQPYFVAASEGRVMLDAARAALRLARERGLTSASAPVFLAGYSQGGHAAFAAADLAARYAPELRLAGVIGYAPAMDVSALLRERPVLAPYVLRSYAAYYGHSAKSALQDRWLPSLKTAAEQRCVSTVGHAYPNDAAKLYRPAFRAALSSGALQGYDPALSRLLALNAPGFAPAGRNVPALVLTGLADPIVTARAQLAFVRKSCAFGRPIAQFEYAGVGHYQARQFGFRDTLAWMQGRAEGRAAPSVCALAKYAPKRKWGTPEFVIERR